MNLKSAPEVFDEAVLLWQVQKFDQELHPLPCLFGRKAVDSAKEPERVTDGELVIQRYVLSNNHNGNAT